MPLVHRVDDQPSRAKLIGLLSRAGVGTYAHFRKDISLATYAETRAEFLQFDTYYRNWKEVAAAAKEAGLTISYRYTRHLYLQKLSSVLSRGNRWEYPKGGTEVRDWLSFAILPYFSTLTVALSKPHYYGSWRANANE